jgi:PAS domain S-box-containing protein
VQEIDETYADIDKLQSYFQTEVVGILEAGPDGRITKVNRGFIKLVGYDEHELVGRTFVSITAPEDQATSLDYLERLNRGELNVCQFEKRYLSKTGDVLPVLTSVQAGKRDASGRPQWYVTFVVSLAEVQRVQSALSSLTQKHESIYDKTINVLARAVEARDPYTAGHQENVAAMAVKIGERLGLDEDRLQGLYLGATVHDIGKIAVPVEFLTKPTALNALEWSYIQSHVDTGYRILREVDAPWPLAEMVHQHHERLDGSGYPRGLVGAEIILESRIISVADTVDSMMKPRPYRSELGAEVTISTLKSAASERKFDHEVVEACLSLRAPFGG